MRTNIYFHKILKNKYKIAFLLLLTFATISCQNNVLETEEIQERCSEEVSFITTIKPIIDANCIQCHNGNQFPDLRTYQGINQNAESVKNETSSRRMPLGGGTLTTEEIEAIFCWVENGAQNN